jgi:hypothetical protein
MLYYLHKIRGVGKYLSEVCTETLFMHLFQVDLIIVTACFIASPTQRSTNFRECRMLVPVLSIRHQSFVISHLFIELQKLTVRYIIELKILLMTYKVLHDLAPQYLMQLVSVKSWTHYHLHIPITVFSLTILRIRVKLPLGT